MNTSVLREAEVIGGGGGWGGAGAKCTGGRKGREVTEGDGGGGRR